MSISFNSVPSNLRVPFVAVEFDSSRAQQGPALLTYKALLIGQKLAAGTPSADTLYKVTNVDQVIALAGRGSMLHRQALAWFASNKSTELWIGVLADNGAGVAATGTIVVNRQRPRPARSRSTSAASASPSASTPATPHDRDRDAIAAAINANLDLPVTAGVVGSTVT
jgi:phage tail sheath gpL-like